MFTIFGSKQRYCDNINRRGFLKIGAFGAGLTLTDLLRLRANAAPAKATSNKSAILIYLPGGPPHLDMYDLKPDAPKEFRGEFSPIQTNVPGVQICELFPRQAKIWDKMAVIRSCIGTNEHSDSAVLTGYSEFINRTQHHPSVGSVISKLRSAANSDIPPYVTLRGLSRGQEPGFLGVAHRAFNPSGPGVENLRLARGVSEDRLADRKELLAHFDTARRDMDATGTMKGLDAFASRAFDMVTSGAVRRALDLTQEDAKTRERYKGVERFLTARRLVEAGVGCVSLSYGGWDLHSGNFQSCRKQLPNVDRAIANLIEDLHDRGMANDVVTVMAGEFGRTPKINNNNAGRDHGSQVISVLVAGGGRKRGQAVGSTSARAESPKDRPYRVPQVLSTVYHAMGIDPSQTFNDGSGRPRYILDDREPVSELV